MSYSNAEQIRALNALDEDWGRAQLPPHFQRTADSSVVLVALHKARYEHSGCEAVLRHESRLWLQLRGYRRQGGRDWPPPGVLPL